MDTPVQWLLEGPPWLVYRARLDLLGKEWEFGQKREPSRWVTLVAWRAYGWVIHHSPMKEATVDGTTQNWRLCL
jgi:hypothetical protein